jgi:TolB-like protein
VTDRQVMLYMTRSQQHDQESAAAMAGFSTRTARLGVRYVLEGSVRRAGNRLRFTGQLIDCSSGVHIWADRFEGTTNLAYPVNPHTHYMLGASP